MDQRRNGNIVPNGAYHQAAETNNKKKPKKWSLGGLFKRRRAKSSDTDSSTELEDKKKGFLALRSPNRHKSASRKVVGKFETIIIPRNEPPETQVTNGGYTLSSIENYDASPNVIKRETAYRNSGELAKGSNGSIENASRRNGKQQIKAKVEAYRDRLGDSSSDECGGSSRTSTGGSSKTSTLQRKTRAARTDRYIRRHIRESNGAATAGVTHHHSNSDSRLANGGHTLVGSPQSRWVARIVYQQSHDYPYPYAAETQSAASSPLGSRADFQCSSLPGKCSSALLYHSSRVPYASLCRSPMSCDSLPKVAPPPPPRNPYRKIVPLDKCVEGRPSSYAFDASIKSTDIFGSSRLQRKSNSDAALQSDNRPKQPSYAPSKYCADRSPRSRNPIQLANQKEDPYPVPNGLKVVNSNSMLVPDKNGFRYANDRASTLSKANEIGIPVSTLSTIYANVVNNNDHDARKSIPENGVRGRPLSVVSEKSDIEFLSEYGGGCPQTRKSLIMAERFDKHRKPKNLEDALVELEEIYNSLQLSDEDLLDRADRRDLQSAIRMNSNFSRHSWNDLDESRDDDPDERDESRKMFSLECLYSPEERYLYSPRLPTHRRSARPDRVADDMAYRKLNKRGNADPISNPNLVSQSGSFLLVSPALSPPPLVDVQPIITQITKEPDITLDDVVFRNIRHTNNTLKVVDPQPPFGIPVGPVSPAPNSDYLHATPSEKYRSTFNPMRTPDVVKDDLAFRNLRKDVQTRPDVAATQHFIVPSASSDSRKRRAIRSLSANIVSMVGKDGDSSGGYSSENEDSAVDVNCNNLVKGNRCVSFNNLPDILEDYRNRRRVLMKNCDECLDREETQSGHTRSVSQIADEARMLSDELREKLRELDAIPPVANGADVDIAKKDDGDRVFRKRVALHKPITLSQFKIDDKTETREMADRARSEPTENVARNVNSRKNFNNWKTRGCSQPQDVHDEGEFADYECSLPLLPADENSSSGVSSTSNSPNTSLTAFEINSVSCDFYLGGATTYSSVESHALSSTCSRDIIKVSSDDAARFRCDRIDKNASSDELNSGRKCSRIEITLSPPQPSGTASSLSSVVPTLVSNFDVVAFAIMYFIACLHTVFFTTFSILEMALLLISVFAYFVVYRRR